jgi:hypothetical protein
MEMILLLDIRIRKKSGCCENRTIATHTRSARLFVAAWPSRTCYKRAPRPVVQIRLDLTYQGCPRSVSMTKSSNVQFSNLLEILGMRVARAEFKDRAQTDTGTICGVLFHYQSVLEPGQLLSRNAVYRPEPLHASLICPVTVVNTYWFVVERHFHRRVSPILLVGRGNVQTHIPECGYWRGYVLWIPQCRDRLLSNQSRFRCSGIGRKP